MIVTLVEAAGHTTASPLDIQEGSWIEHSIDDSLATALADYFTHCTTCTVCIDDGYLILHQEMHWQDYQQRQLSQLAHHYTLWQTVMLHWQYNNYSLIQPICMMHDVAREWAKQWLCAMVKWLEL
jgi:hypothetical protein